MWDDFITRQIRRTNRNLLILGTVILAALGAALGACWRDAYNFVLGPFPTSSAELAQIKSPDGPKRYFLKVKGEESFLTGMRVVDANDHDKIRAEIIALTVGDRLLLVKAPLDKDRVQFSGTLAEIPPQLFSGVVAPWNTKYPDKKGMFLPFMLDTTGFRSDSDNLLAAAGAGVIGLIGLGLVGIPLRRMLMPDKHPLLVQLAKYGSLQDVRIRLDSELRAEGGGEKFGAMQITTNWLMDAAAYKTGVMATKDVVWAYPKVTKHYHSGIPTGKTYSAIIRDSKGQSLEISGKKDSVPKMLESLQRRMPWVLLGFNKELDTMWLKEKPKFFQLMEQRRAKLATATR